MAGSRSGEGFETLSPRSAISVTSSYLRTPAQRRASYCDGSNPEGMTVPSDEKTSVLARLRVWARRIRRDVVALWLAGRDPRVSWYAKFAAGLVAAYALSPIDLIPDFIPVLGYLDELIILPLGILLVVKLIPPTLMAEFRAEADRRAERPVSRAGAVAVVALWIAIAVFFLWVFWPDPAR
jgi:uncharacterized membrane protein YkvA (DUF1232 family)